VGTEAGQRQRGRETRGSIERSNRTGPRDLRRRPFPVSAGGGKRLQQSHKRATIVMLRAPQRKPAHTHTPPSTPGPCAAREAAWT